MLDEERRAELLFYSLWGETSSQERDSSYPLETLFTDRSESADTS